MKINSWIQMRTTYLITQLAVNISCVWEEGESNRPSAADAFGGGAPLPVFGAFICPLNTNPAQINGYDFSPALIFPEKAFPLLSSQIRCFRFGLLSGVERGWKVGDKRRLGIIGIGGDAEDWRDQMLQFCCGLPPSTHYTIQTRAHSLSLGFCSIDFSLPFCRHLILLSLLFTPLSIYIQKHVCISLCFLLLF